jgi:DNA-binding ferritin-like protein
LLGRCGPGFCGHPILHNKLCKSTIQKGKLDFRAISLDMIAELADDNKTLAERLREAHNVCEEHRDVVTASLIEVWIDETERCTWFLSEIERGPH